MNLVYSMSLYCLKTGSWLVFPLNYKAMAHLFYENKQMVVIIIGAQAVFESYNILEKWFYHMHCCTLPKNT